MCGFSQQRGPFLDDVLEHSPVTAAAADGTFWLDAGACSKRLALKCQE